MNKGKLLYEGKAKRIFEYTNDSNLVISEFKDDLTAFDGKQKDVQQGKGILNNKISSKLFKLLEDNNIDTHFVEMLDDSHMLHKKCEMIMIEVIVRNIAAGSLCRNLGIEEGKILPFTLVEFDYKNDDLGDPKLNDQHCIILDLIKKQEDLDYLRSSARQINSILKPFFDGVGLTLVDFKLEYGFDAKSGKIILADELSPDNCRFWDKKSGDSLDKDIFRKGGGNVKIAYEEVLSRLGAL